MQLGIGNDFMQIYGHVKMAFVQALAWAQKPEWHGYDEKLECCAVCSYELLMNESLFRLKCFVLWANKWFWYGTILFNLTNKDFYCVGLDELCVCSIRWERLICLMGFLSSDLKRWRMSWYWTEMILSLFLGHVLWSTRSIFPYLSLSLSLCITRINFSLYKCSETLVLLLLLLTW